MTRSDSDPGAPAAPQRQRIAKLMARAGLCSRRDAEAWIVAGRVSVNGKVLSSPAVDVAREDKILVDGAPLPAPEKTRLFLFHKPRGLVTSDHDPEGRATVADFLRTHWPEGPRVVTVGRLDINTEGLLLLTNDGGLARALELPQTGWLRRYRVRAKGTADPAALDALAEGVTIDGIAYAGIEAKLDRVQGANVWLTMGLREGKNREVKRVLEHMGLEVNRLIRLSFGPFQLADLAEGTVEEVRTRVLRDQLGEKLAAQAGVDFHERRPEKPPAAEPRTAKPGTSKPGTTKPRTTETRADKAREKDTDRRERTPRGRPGRAEHGSRSEAPRPGDRHARRRPSDDAAPPPKRERPKGGPRKHVMTLRKEAASFLEGPRVRIERSDTRDRRDRTVAVERRVSSRGAATDGRPTRTASDRRGSSANDHASPRPPRREPDERTRQGSRYGRPDGARHHEGRDERPTKQGRRMSPSAAGKRERIARSGPRRDETRPRGERADRPAAADARERPARGGSRREDPRARSEMADRPAAARTRSRPPRHNERADRPSDRTRRSEPGKPATPRPRKAEGDKSRRPTSDRSRKPSSGKPFSDRPRKGPNDRPRGPSKPKR